jgi:hypothetical protein
LNKDELLKKGLEVWGNYIASVKVLTDGKYLWTNRDPKTDFAEWIVKSYFGGELADKTNNPGYDVTVGTKRIQVKSVSKADTNPNGFHIKEKDRKNNDATHYAFVWFEDKMPDSIFLCPVEFVRDFPGDQIKRKDLEGNEQVTRYTLHE